MKRRIVHVHFALTHAGVRWALVALLLALNAAPLVCESLTLSTYYPAPLGVYKQLIATGAGSANTLLARDGGSVGIGLGAASPKNRLDVAGAVAVGDYAGATAAGANAANGLIVSGNVGIGTSNPAGGAALHVYSKNGTVALGTGGQTLSVDNANMFKLNSAAPSLGLFAGGSFAGGLQAGGGTVSVVNRGGDLPFSASAAATEVNFAGNPVLIGDAAHTSVELGGSPVLQAQGSCGGSVACTGLGVNGSFPLVVYASPRSRLATDGYYESTSDAGCQSYRTWVEGEVCPKGYYATWTAGFKSSGFSYQNRPMLPNGILYTLAPGSGGSGGYWVDAQGNNRPYQGLSSGGSAAGAQNFTAVPVNVDWNASTFLCCPN